MKTEKYIRGHVAMAVRKNLGNVNAAARELGCNRSTVLRYIKKYQDVAQAQEEGRQAFFNIGKMQNRASTLRALTAYYNIKNSQLMQQAEYHSKAYITNILKAHPNYVSFKALNKLELAMKEILGKDKLVLNLTIE